MTSTDRDARPPETGGRAAYLAGVAVIRRDSDGLLATRWGLTDAATGEPVRATTPGPWTWTDPNGGQWRHVGADTAGTPAVLLFTWLDDAQAWVRARGGDLYTSSKDLPTPTTEGAT